MNSDQQQAFEPLIRDRLEEIRSALSMGAADREAIAPDKAIGRLSRLDSMQMQQMALAGKRRLEQEIRDLEDALRRISAGRYGICQMCGKDIPTERLEYQPAATCCVKCLESSRR